MSNEDLKDLSFRAQQIDVGIRSGLDHLRTVLDQQGLIYARYGDVEGLTASELIRARQEAANFLRQELEAGHLNEAIAPEALEAIRYYTTVVNPPLYSPLWPLAKFTDFVDCVISLLNR